MRRLLQILFSIILLAALPAVAAVEVAGVKFDDSARLGAADLALNGAGLRTRVFFKVYAIGLYLPEKKNTTDAVLGLKGAKRIQIVTLRELTAEQFADALISALEKNHSEAELAQLKARVDEFRGLLLSLGTATKGTVISLDFMPESGTRLLFNGTPKGKNLPGEDFYKALLKIWLGEHPAQDDLKDAMLGKVPQ